MIWLYRLGRWTIGLALIGSLLVALYAGQAGQTRELRGIIQVIDGDTLNLNGRVIRLHGIDAPELHQFCTRPTGFTWPCGAVAKSVLDGLIAEQEVSCLPPIARDKYRRIITKCWIIDAEGGMIDLGGWMVWHGWAIAYTRYSAEYLPQESIARQERVGIWSGEFEQPWQWRKEHSHGK